MRKKILIVEDQFIEANNLQMILEKEGYRVCAIARSVPIALEIIESEKPDLKTPFVFVGPEGFPFPRESEANFKSMYQKMWNELYGGRKEYDDSQVAGLLPPPNKSFERTAR